MEHRAEALNVAVTRRLSGNFPIVSGEEGVHKGFSVSKYRRVKTEKLPSWAGGLSPKRQTLSNTLDKNPEWEQ
jgi:hypothetical protein